VFIVIFRVAEVSDCNARYEVLQNKSSDTFKPAVLLTVAVTVYVPAVSIVVVAIFWLLSSSVIVCPPVIDQTTDSSRPQ